MALVCKYIKVQRNPILSDKNLSDKNASSIPILAV
jgi:hypothetical protein